MYKFLLSSLILLSMVNTTFAAESLDTLYKRVKISSKRVAIKASSQAGFEDLPAKGFSNGLTGALQKFKLYPSPRDSFVSCDDDVKYTEVRGKAAPGCVVSLKLARKFGESLEDTGIRVEYAIGPGEKQFVPNNSAWARNLVSGNGLFEASLGR